RRGSLTIVRLPYVSHSDFDHLLWACDVNFVRGEDSFVRAQWAERPFIWQIYPQSEDTHLVKLNAFLDRYLERFPSPHDVREFWLAWNGVGSIGPAWDRFVSNRSMIEHHGKQWANQLDLNGDLTNNLGRFVQGKLSHRKE
ncbi:MAG: elongation factor P maturation arginine rhamnosyltransferase EarP, partial [Planctomycetes bacterium]|nr:elongation factor P maturation arginine rhamnosyltransferase EarP [Planctomycetota bacterium]